MIGESTNRGRFLPLAILLALAIHFALIFLWKPKPSPTNRPPEFGIEQSDSAIEVDLVESLPTEEPTEDISEETIETPEIEEIEEVIEQNEQTEQLEEEKPPIEELSADVQLEEKDSPISTEEVKEEVAPPVVSKDKPKPSSPSLKTSPSKKPSTPTKSSIGGTGSFSGSSASSQPRYLRNPHPPYPSAARKAKQEGVVRLKVTVNARGGVDSVRVDQSSGFPLLDQQAVSTVRSQWRFKPAMEDGKKVSAEILIPIRFRLQ